MHIWIGRQVDGSGRPKFFGYTVAPDRLFSIAALPQLHTALHKVLEGVTDLESPPGRLCQIVFDPGAGI